MTEKDFLENEDFILLMLFKDPKSLKHWELYLKKHPEDQVHFESAKKAFKKIHFNNQLLKEKDRTLLHKRIFEGSNKSKTLKRRKLKIYSAIAACALVFFLFRVSNSFKPQQDSEIIVEHPTTASEIELIASGETFILENNEVLTVNQGGTIHTKAQTLTENNSENYNILKVPYGKRTELILADGSKLWVNSGSTVKFPSKFSDDKRSIYIEGEIFIEVTKNKLKPFNVETSKFNVNVYGTTFDVKAYKNSTEQRVVLVEGSVGVTTIDNMEANLVPNQSLDITASKLVKKNIDTEIYTSWKNGYLIFNDSPLEHVLIELSRYYNVTFLDADKTLLNKMCTGKIYLSSNLNDVIETLSALSGGTFKVKKKNTN